jgi:hypothetical protein
MTYSTGTSFGGINEKSVGSVKWKVLPRPNSDSIQMAPPWLWMTFWDMYSPKPEPSALIFLAFEPR